MGRILAIDYGTKRVGIAVTDPLQMIANPLTTIHSKDVIQFLKDYTTKEEVDCFVIGEPRRMNYEASGPEKQIEAFIRTLKKQIPGIQIERVDERFTSKIAFQAMIDAGLKKKDRANKELVDMISAAVILQSYLEIKSNSLNNN
jgi:putative Holliday junction resolvase